VGTSKIVTPADIILRRAPPQSLIKIARDIDEGLSSLHHWLLASCVRRFFLGTKKPNTTAALVLSQLLVPLGTLPSHMSNNQFLINTECVIIYLWDNI
jgi:hypothetical protein